jgi:hypothetical protein
MDDASDSSDATTRKKTIDTHPKPMPKTPPCCPQQLKAALVRLQDTFDLVDEQIDALPSIHHISLVRHPDSTNIKSIDGARFAHPYKLYVGDKKRALRGERRKDAAYVYLFHSTRPGCRMKTEINNGETKECQWAPIEINSFGSVSNLRFPFHGNFSWKHRSAVVKFYFQLGLEAGLYSSDTGFQITEEWKEHLHRACNDLFEARNEIKDRQRQAVEATRTQQHDSSASEPNTTVATDDPPTPQRAQPRTRDKNTDEGTARTAMRRERIQQQPKTQQETRRPDHASQSFELFTPQQPQQYSHQRALPFQLASDSYVADASFGGTQATQPSFDNQWPPPQGAMYQEYQPSLRHAPSTDERREFPEDSLLERTKPENLHKSVKIFSASPAPVQAQTLRHQSVSGQLLLLASVPSANTCPVPTNEQRLASSHTSSTRLLGSSPKESSMRCTTHFWRRKVR